MKTFYRQLIRLTIVLAVGYALAAYVHNANKGNGHYVMSESYTVSGTRPYHSYGTGMVVDGVHYTDVTIYSGNNGDTVSFCAVGGK